MISGCFSSCARYSLTVSARWQRAEKPERRSSEATISKSASWSSKIKAKRGLGTSGSGHTSLIEQKGKDYKKKKTRILPSRTSRCVPPDPSANRFDTYSLWHTRHERVPDQEHHY